MRTKAAGLSKVAATVIALILIAVAIAGIYIALPSYFHSNSTSSFSVEALSLNTSSNLSSSVNVNSQSHLVRMDLYINGTFIGACNYSWIGSTIMSNGIPVTTRSWNNGTYSMMFSISPQYLPRMSGIHMMYNAAYMVEMVAHFQDGATYTVNHWIYIDNNGFSSMIDQGGSWWSNMMGRYYSVQTVSIGNVINDMHNAPNDTNIFQNNNTIAFTGTQNITILAIGMMPDKATNLTGMNPPSYASDDVFVIYGLIDPTLVIPSGLHINLIFANLDDDMYHNLVVTSIAPPYYYMPMQGMMFSNSSAWYGSGMGGMMGGFGSGSPIFGTTMPLLSPANYTQGTAYYYTTTFNLYSYSANYWYICTYPGHAQSGMYGRILVSS